MNKEEFSSKMTEVANILGLTWVWQPEYVDNTGELKGPDNICIWVRNGGYNEVGKIKIASVYPRDSKGGDHAYTKDILMRVSETKTPEQIAKDIQRRFLPDYLAKLQVVKVDIARQNTYYNQKENNIKMIAERFGWEVKDNYNNISSIYPDIPEIWDITARNNKEVEFKVRCGPEMVIKIIELLKKGAEKTWEELQYSKEDE